MNSLIPLVFAAAAALTPETRALLNNMRDIPGRGKVLVSWTFPWDWHKNERDCPLEAAGGNLEKAGQVERAIGLSPLLYFEDFYKVAGTYRSRDFYERHRRLLSQSIRTAYERWGSVPVLGWHPENPYVPTNMSRKVHGDSSFYAWRYKSNGYPQEHRYVFREILDGTGAACGLGRDTRARKPDGAVRPYPNPRAWFMARMQEMADFLKTLVDGGGRPIPVIVRLWHECEDDWAWWQSGSATRDDYVRMFRLTVDELRRRTGGGRNLLFLYSPDKNWETLGDRNSEMDFMYRYPGDAYVDIIGYDDYSFGQLKGCGNLTDEEKELRLSEQFCESVRKMRLVTDEAAIRGKACGLVETGLREKVADTCSRFLGRALAAPGVGFSFVNFWCYSTIPESSPDAFDDWRRFMEDGRRLTARDRIDLTKWEGPPPQARRWNKDPRLALCVALDLRGAKRPRYWDLRKLMDVMSAAGFKRLELKLASEDAFPEERIRDLSANCVRYRKMGFGVTPDPYRLSTPVPDAVSRLEVECSDTENLHVRLLPQLLERYREYGGIEVLSKKGR